MAEKIIVFGTGSRAEKFCISICMCGKNYEVESFFDNDVKKWGGARSLENQ